MGTTHIEEEELPEEESPQDVELLRGSKMNKDIVGQRPTENLGNGVKV